MLASRSDGNTMISAAVAKVSGSIMPEEKASTASSSEERRTIPPALSSRNGKKTAATISTSAVAASITIRVIACSRGAIRTVPQRLHRACAPTGTGASTCNASQVGQAISLSGSSVSCRREPVIARRGAGESMASVMTPVSRSRATDARRP